MTENNLSNAHDYLVKCPEGYHKRKSYISPSGKKIGSQCVRTVTRKKTVKSTGSRRLKLLPRIKSLARQACPPGMIERKEYDRRYSTAILQKGFTKKSKNGRTIHVKPSKNDRVHVEASCIKDKGLPGKGTQSIGPLRKGELSKHGYSMQHTTEKRQTALRKAIKEYGALGVYRKLDAVTKLTVRTIPEASKIYEKDRDWVKETFGPLNRRR